MKKIFVYLLVLKIVALGFLVASFSKNPRWSGQSALAKAAEAPDVPVKPAPAAQEGDDLSVPDIPAPADLSLSNAYQIREQLELLKQDVEEKIIRLKSTKVAFDKVKKDIDASLKKVAEDRRLLDETLQKEKKVQQERLSEALTFLEKMEPRKAGPVLEAMDRDLVIQLFRKLPQKQVTKLLEAVTPKKATELLEFYTRMRSGREYAILKEIGLCKNEEPQSQAAEAPPAASGGQPQQTRPNSPP